MKSFLLLDIQQTNKAHVYGYDEQENQYQIVRYTGLGFGALCYGGTLVKV